MKLIEIEIINIQTDCSLLKALKKEYSRLYYMRLLAKLFFLAHSNIKIKTKTAPKIYKRPSTGLFQNFFDFH